MKKEIQLVDRNVFPIYVIYVNNLLTKKIYTYLEYLIYYKGRVIDVIKFALISDLERVTSDPRVPLLYINNDTRLLTVDEKGFVFLYKNYIPLRIYDQRFQVEERYLDELKTRDKVEKMLTNSKF